MFYDIISTRDGKYNMNIFQDMLNKALDYRNMTAADLAKISGISEAAISHYKNGKYKATQCNLEKLSIALNVSIPWLMGADVPMEKQPYYDIYSRFPEPNIDDDCVHVPVIGEIAAGYDHWAVENWDGDTVNIPAEYLNGHSKSDFYVLTVHGDSMYPTILTYIQISVLLLGL